GRADEHAVGELRGLVDQRIILHLAVVAHLHTGADIRTAPDNAVLAHADALTHLREMPDRGAVANGCTGRDVGGIDNARGSRCCHVQLSAPTRMLPDRPDSLPPPPPGPSQTRAAAESPIPGHPERMSG